MKHSQKLHLYFLVLHVFLNDETDVLEGEIFYFARYMYVTEVNKNYILVLYMKLKRVVVQRLEEML